MRAAPYTICGKPAWSREACHTCDSCVSELYKMRKVMSAAQNVVAIWETEGLLASDMIAAMTILRSKLDGN